MIEEITLLKTNRNHAFLSGLEVCGFQEGGNVLQIEDYG
jgi:hypothetical protein